MQRRPKRIGIEWQQLRADASVFLEWLRLNYRQGWLNAPATNPTVLVSDLDDGEAAVVRLNAIREKAGLTACYGPQAKRLKLGEATPPSRRKPQPKRGGRGTGGPRPRKTARR